MVEFEGGSGERREELSDDALFEEVIDDTFELSRGIGENVVKSWLNFNTQSGPPQLALSERTPVYFHAEPSLVTIGEGSPSLSVFYKTAQRENQGFKSRLFKLDPTSVLRQGAYSLYPEDVRTIADLAQNRTKNVDKQRFRIVDILNKRIPPTP